MKKRNRPYKLKLPDKIRLLNFDYKIISKDKTESKNNLGYINFDTKEIFIKKGLSPLDTLICLYHECSHFFQSYYGLEESEILSESLSRFFLQINSQLGCVYGKRRRK